MRIIFRYDDFSAGQDVSLETDQVLFDLFRRHHVPIVVGATPCMARVRHDSANTIFYPLGEDAARVKLLADCLADGWQLALHGYTHRRSRTRISEFVGEPKQAQMAKLKNGLRDLRNLFPSVPIEVFIPPWNSFDRTTMKCLATLGFRVLCAGRALPRGPVENLDAAEERDCAGLCFVPSFVETRAFVDYLKGYSVQDLERVIGDAWLAVTMHGFDFDGSKPPSYVSHEELDQALAKVREARSEIGTIPIGVEPPIFNGSQECILKGKILLSRRRAIRPFLPSSNSAKNEHALTYVGDGIASLAWKLRTRLKGAV